MRTIGMFLLAVGFMLSPFLAKGVQAQDEVADIVDTAVAAGSFETLVAAVEAAGLVDTLKGEGPFTVFAPTDEAFAALPEGTVEALLQDPEGALTDILLYHVLPGTVLAADVVGLDGSEVETVGGASVVITVDGDSVKVNDATVIQTDIEAANGVIHVIDAVLIPPTGETVGDEAADSDSDVAEVADDGDGAVDSGNEATEDGDEAVASEEGEMDQEATESGEDAVADSMSPAADEQEAEINRATRGNKNGHGTKSGHHWSHTQRSGHNQSARCW